MEHVRATVRVLRAWKGRQAAERLRRVGVARQRPGVHPPRRLGLGNPQEVTKRFQQLAKAAGLPLCRLHDLRHLSASRQLAAGVDIAVVSKRLRHSALSFTCDAYCRLIGKTGRQAADKSTALVVRSRTRAGLDPSIYRACGRPQPAEDDQGAEKPHVR